MFAAMSVGIHRHAGRLDAAIAEFHKAVELDPHSGLAYFHVGSAYFAKGMLDEARASFERSLELTVFSGWADGFLGIVFAAQGERGAAERMLQDLLEKRRRTYVPPFGIALLSWVMGKADLAFEYFDRAFDERDSVMPLINVLPDLAGLRSEPRFKTLLERLRFPASR